MAQFWGLKLVQNSTAKEREYLNVTEKKDFCQEAKRLL
jgi:hypothetical protein